MVKLRTDQQVQISCGQVLVPQSRHSRHNIRSERVVPENVKSFSTQLFLIETTCSVLEGRGRQRVQVFEFGDMGSEVTVFSDSDWAGEKETRNRQARESRSQDDTV